MFEPGEAFMWAEAKEAIEAGWRRICEEVGLDPNQQDELVKGAYTVGFGQGSMHELERRMAADRDRSRLSEP